MPFDGRKCEYRLLGVNGKLCGIAVLHGLHL